MSTSPPLRRLNVSLLGGMRRDGRFSTGSQSTFVALIGGLTLDLRDAQIPAGGFTLTKVSPIGGVRLIVPPGVQVEVGGFTLVGGKKIEQDVATPAEASVVRVRAFGVIGGVKVSVAR